MIRFGEFLADEQVGELWRNGEPVRLQGQPLAILLLLLKHPGRLVTRDQIQRHLWPADTFVSFEQSMNAAVNRLREALGDSADHPAFIETVPRRGYRFIGAVESANNAAKEQSDFPPARIGHSRASRGLAAVILTAAALIGLYWSRPKPVRPRVPTLTKVTFDSGLQTGVTWSPDGKYLAYASDRDGKFEIYVQQVDGGNPVKVSSDVGDDWQPNWSPDGKFIAFRSEEGEGGIFVIPVLGGPRKKISSFGYYPSWSPDSSQILFRTHLSVFTNTSDNFYVANLASGITSKVPTDFLSNVIGQFDKHGISAAWHPDGKRITVWVGTELLPQFWTVAVAGGPALKTEITDALATELVGASDDNRIGQIVDSKFQWDPAGKGIYFERTVRAARNVWRIDLEPATLRATGLRRVTVAPGVNADFALSSDGKKIAYTSESLHACVWAFPFDVAQKRLSGVGRAVTPQDAEAGYFTLSPDGSKIAFAANKRGRFAFHQIGLLNNTESEIFSEDGYNRFHGQWSRSGDLIAYDRFDNHTQTSQIVIASPSSKTETEVTSPSSISSEVYDWSPDGKTILATKYPDPSPAELWAVPVSGQAHSGDAAVRLVARPGTHIFQERFSPDQKWIIFEAVTPSVSGIESRLFVIPSSGGDWIPITSGKQWDDKPRWSADGKTIYFVSGSGGFYNAWHIGFDPKTGRPTGKPAQITHLNRPSQMVPQEISFVGFDIAGDNLALSIEQSSGNIWVAENIN